MRSAALLLVIPLALACGTSADPGGGEGSGGGGPVGGEPPAPGLYAGELDLEGWERPLPFALGVHESEGSLVVSLAIDRASPSRAAATWTGEALALSGFEARTAPPSCRYATLEFERLELRFESDRVIGEGKGTAEVFEIDYFYDVDFELELVGEHQKALPSPEILVQNPDHEWAAFGPIVITLDEPGWVVGAAELEMDEEPVAVDLEQHGRRLTLTPAAPLPWGSEGSVTVQVEDLLGERHDSTVSLRTERAPSEPPDSTLADLGGYLLHGVTAMTEEDRTLLGVPGGFVAHSEVDWSVDFPVDVPDTAEARLEIDWHLGFGSGGLADPSAGGANVRVGTAEGISHPPVEDREPEPDTGPAVPPPGWEVTGRWTRTADLSPWRGQQVVVSIYGDWHDICGPPMPPVQTWITRAEVLP